MNQSYTRVKKIIKGMGHKFLPADDECVEPRMQYSFEGQTGYMILYHNDNKRTILRRLTEDYPEYNKWVRDIRLGYKSYY